MRKRHIIMLASSERSALCIYDNSKLAFSKEESFKIKEGINQHLYVLSDDNIENGDWVYHSYVNGDTGNTEFAVSLHKEDSRMTSDSRRVIAY